MSSRSSDGVQDDEARRPSQVTIFVVVESDYDSTILSRAYRSEQIAEESCGPGEYVQSVELLP